MLISLVVHLRELYSYFAMFSCHRVTDYLHWLRPGGTGSGSKTPSGISLRVQAELDSSLPALSAAIRALKCANDSWDSDEILRAVASVLQLVEEAWLLPTIGRQVADEICNKIRLDGGLELILQLIQSPDIEITYAAARVLEQILVAENRYEAFPF